MAKEHIEDIHLDLHSDQRLRLAKEMYIKAILQISKEQDGKVRPVDLVKCLEVTKGSVSEMLKKLEADRLLDYQSFKDIRLTPQGKKKAGILLKKYQIIREFLEKKLNLKGNELHDQACNLEHAFTDNTVIKLEKFLKK